MAPTAGLKGLALLLLLFLCGGEAGTGNPSAAHGYETPLTVTVMDGNAAEAGSTSSTFPFASSAGGALTSGASLSPALALSYSCLRSMYAAMALPTSSKNVGSSASRSLQVAWWPAMFSNAKPLMEERT